MQSYVINVMIKVRSDIMRKNIDLMGQRFNNLLVIKEVDRNKYGTRQWLCRCDCGNYIIETSNHITTGHTKSCGCYKIKFAKQIFTKHGKKHTRLYNIWCGIKQRCYDVNSNNYKRYGARGIVVCDEWKNDFMSFYNWAMNNGYQDDLSIDRMDNNGNYEPCNCRWATIETQSNNKRSNHVVIYNGISKTVGQWSTDLNINYGTLLSRLLRGWSVERAFTQPVRKGKTMIHEDNIK